MAHSYQTRQGDDLWYSRWWLMTYEQRVFDHVIICCLMINKKRDIFFHKFYGHQTWHGSGLQHGTWSHIGNQYSNNHITLSKKFFPFLIFFYLRIVPLILHRATIRLLLLVRESKREGAANINIYKSLNLFVVSFDSWIFYH